MARLNQALVEGTEYRTVPGPEIGFAALDGQPGKRSQAGACFPDAGRIELAPGFDLTTAETSPTEVDSGFDERQATTQKPEPV